MVQLLVLSPHSKKALGLTLVVGWGIAVWYLCLHEVPVLVFTSHTVQKYTWSIDVSKLALSAYVSMWLSVLTL